MPLELPLLDPELRRRLEITKRESPPIGGAPLSIPLGRFRAKRRWAFHLLVDADVRVEPPILTVLVDLAFADEEARIQPAVRLSLGRDLNMRENRAAMTGRPLFDALAVDRKE